MSCLLNLKDVYMNSPNRPHNKSPSNDVHMYAATYVFMEEYHCEIIVLLVVVYVTIALTCYNLLIMLFF